MRVTGTLELDGTTVALNQGGNATTISAGSPAGDITLTLPATTDTLVGRATTDTLTNKTLTSPTLTTPSLGVATATSINKVTITAPATSATLTIVDGGSLITAGAYATTLTSTAATNVTLPTTGTLATLAGTETFTNKTLTSPKLNENVAVTTTATKLNYITNATGTTGTDTTNIVFSTSPALTTPTIATQMDILAAAPIRFQDSAGGEYVGIKAPATVGASYTLTLPTADGTNGYALVTNGSGTLSWASALSNPMDSEGDIIYGGVGGAATKLDAGTANYLLQANGAAAPSWVTNLTIGTINGNTISTGTGTLTLGAGSTLATSATNSITLTSTGATNVTLPTTGTLATLAGTETFTNKTLTSPKLNENVVVTTTATKLNYITNATGTTGTDTTNIVFSTSPTLVTPTLGAASATSINKVAITAPATGSTLTIADGKTLTASNTLTFTGTDSSSVAFGTGGTVTYTSNKLSVFSATSSAELAGVISDETGSGALVFAAAPTLTGAVQATGNILAGYGTSRTTWYGATNTPIIQQEGASANTARFMSVVYNAADTNAPGLFLGKSRSATNGGVTVVQSGDDLGTINFFGADGTDMAEGAAIVAQVDGTPGANDMPGRLTFKTSADGAQVATERMRIDSTGTMLLGHTTSRTSWLGSTLTPLFQQEGASSNTARFMSVAYNSADTAAPGLFLGKSRSAALAGVTVVQSGDDLGTINFFGADGVDMAEGATIVAQVDGTPGSNDMPGRLIFKTTADGAGTSTERMRIDSTGKVGIGITPTSILHVSVDGSSSNDGALTTTGALSNNQYVTWSATSNGKRAALGHFKHAGIASEAAFMHLDPQDGTDNFIWVDDSDILRISTTSTHIGTTSGTVVGAQTSDERLKQNIRPIPYGLTEALALVPIMYELDGKTEIGFGAQTTQSIVPESVFNTNQQLDPSDEQSPADKLTMEYARIVPVLTKAVQELKTQLDAALARIATLENQ